MPLIRCPKCGQAYDVPGVVAVRLPNSIATCQCGEWLSGSKAAVLARLIEADQLREIDMAPFRVDASAAERRERSSEPMLAPQRARSIRIIARDGDTAIHSVFTIHEHPLWIGRHGCHVQLPHAELSIRHCSISVRGDRLVVRDADSHTGTFLDGQAVDEAPIDEGVHLLRVGTALVSVEPTEEQGIAVEPVQADAPLSDEALLSEKLRNARATQPTATRAVLVCLEGPLLGQEFEIPANGLVVGREGHVRVPDEFLSRRHFEIVRDSDGAVRVRDLGSRNGTFLNTLPAKNTKVHPGDEIRAGVNRFRIERRV